MPTTKQLLDAARTLDVANGSTEPGLGHAPGTGANGAIVHTYRQEAARTVITLAAMTVALADNAGVVAYGSKKIFDMPEGALNIKSIVADLAVTKSSAGVNATFNGDFSIGTAAANNTATLTSTEADLLASTATPAAVAGATTARGVNSTPAVFDGSVTAKDVYLNMLVDDGDHDVTTTPCNLIVSGTVTIVWELLGG